MSNKNSNKMISLRIMDNEVLEILNGVINGQRGLFINLCLSEYLMYTHTDEKRKLIERIKYIFKDDKILNKILNNNNDNNNNSDDDKKNDINNKNNMKKDSIKNSTNININKKNNNDNDNNTDNNTDNNNNNNSNDNNNNLDIIYNMKENYLLMSNINENSKLMNVDVDTDIEKNEAENCQKKDESNKNNKDENNKYESKNEKEKIVPIIKETIEEDIYKMKIKEKAKKILI